MISWLPGHDRRIAKCLSALAVAALTLATPTYIGAQAGVRGVVTDSLGGAIAGAQVSSPAGSSAVSDAAGAFRLARVGSGPVTLNVRRLGYLPRSITLVPSANGGTTIQIRLAAVAGVLPTVEIRRRGEVYDARLEGFNARRMQRVGHFITRDALDRRDSPRFADALRSVPGLVVRPLRGSGGGRTVSIRGNCSPLVFFDGFPANAGAVDLDMIDLSTVEGIEIYSGLATVPLEFRSVHGTERCGVIAIWSRPHKSRQRRLAAARAGELERQIASKTVYTAEQVDEPAIMVGGSVSPIYPDTLWRERVTGRVVAEFIVGVDGMIEQASFGVASSTHPYFSASIRNALETAIFRAAILAGRKVRQLVLVPFEFNLDEAPAGSADQPGKSVP